MMKILARFRTQGERPHLPKYLLRGRSRGPHPMTMTTWMGTTLPARRGPRRRRRRRRTPKGKKAAAKSAPVRAGITRQGKGGRRRGRRPTLDTIKEKLTAVMEEESLGKPKGARDPEEVQRGPPSDLDERLPAIIKACDKLWPRSNPKTTTSDRQAGAVTPGGFALTGRFVSHSEGIRINSGTRAASAHAAIPNSSERWIACPGSVQAQAEAIENDPTLDEIQRP